MQQFKAPPKKAPPKKAPPCKGRHCPKPCKGPKCPGNKQAVNQRPHQHNIHINSFTSDGMPTPLKAPQDPHFIDDTFYPKPLLKKMAEKGLNVSGLKTIPGMFHADHSGTSLKNDKVLTHYITSYSLKGSCLTSSTVRYCHDLYRIIYNI